MAFPSTFLDLQNTVIAKLSLDATLDRDRVKDWINQAYSEACEETEANVVVDTMTLTAGSFRYVLPASVCRLRQLYVTAAGSSTPLLPVERTTLDDLMRKRASEPSLTGSATHYTLDGLSVFEVFPTPAAADVLTIYMSQFPVPLADNADVPILQEPFGSRLLELGALAEAGEFKRDPRSEGWKREHGEWLDKFREHLRLRGGDTPGYGHQWGSYADPC